VNVAIAQNPEIPILPEPSLMPVKLGLAGVFALLLSFGGAIGVDFHDRTFRNSAEVTKYLALPVLGSIPLSGDVEQAYRDASAL
jgi:capsular polysaccharide biosynthesis protein